LVSKKELLTEHVAHVDVKAFDSRPIIKAYSKMSFQARNLARASEIYDMMLADTDCAVILCLAGSLFSSGLKEAVRMMVENNMVDAIVSTGAVMVDQDFFEGLGFKHYVGDSRADDSILQKNMIDRIYDTYIDEEDLRTCDMTISEIADGMEPGAYSSREFINRMGEYLDEKDTGVKSVVHEAYKKNVPIFVPAFSDCSAGFGLIHHQTRRKGKDCVHIDSVKDFLELTEIKAREKDTGLFMVGGGVPKNFAQDTTVGAEILGKDVGMHKYAVQITVADERDGALSGSTLKEAHSWGKVDLSYEQMVFCEATIALPLIASAAYHGGNWRKRKPRSLNKIF